MIYTQMVQLLLTDILDTPGGKEINTMKINLDRDSVGCSYKIIIAKGSFVAVLLIGTSLPTLFQEKCIKHYVKHM